MRATLRLPRAATYADYLAVEEHSRHRHELIDGVIVAMAGGTDEHSAIAGRFAMLLGVRLEGVSRYYTPDQRFWIAAQARSRYADGSVIFGPPEHPPHDQQAATNAIFAVEVLPPSDEGDDEGDKRIDFQSLPGLRAYVLLYQDQRCVKVHRRATLGRWPAEPDVHPGGERFSLPLLNAPLSVDEIYDSILDVNGRSLLKQV